jgi:hypothetical protein
MQFRIGSLMKRIVAAVALMLVAAGFGVTASADAAPPKPGQGGACVQAGIGTLKSLGLFQDAVKQKIDYSTLADPTVGPIYADLPQGSFFSLGQVVSLHAASPDLFDWCRSN